jgi:hypothetical protein
MSKYITATICFGLGLLGSMLFYFPTSQAQGISRASLELSVIKVDRAKLAQGDLATLRKVLEMRNVVERLAPSENEGETFREEISDAARRLPLQKEGWSSRLKTQSKPWSNPVTSVRL